MATVTKQMEAWSGVFGREYTNRNPQTVEEMDLLYRQQFGLTRTELNRDFLGELDRSIRILEVGANVGTQLRALQAMGFESLYGIELQSYACEKAKERTRNINLIRGTAFDLPFKDGFFDLVYTSGVLIHISPDDIGRAISEIHRCTKRYIWGFEYFADAYTPVTYREHGDLLWKANFAERYREQFPDLKLVKEMRIPYCRGHNVDSMYLLEKSNADGHRNDGQGGQRS